MKINFQILIYIEMDKLQQTKKIPSNIIIKSAFNLFEKNSQRFPYLYETIHELYNFIFQNNDIDLDELEIEAKFGKFVFRGIGVQGYEYIKEVFRVPIWETRDQAFKYDFVSGLDEEKFFLIWNFVEKEANIPQSNIRKIPPKNYKEIHYKSGKRLSQLIENNKIIREDIIKKEKKIHFNIRNNGNDFRITSCIEKKNEIFDNDETTINRNKFRISYEYQFFRIDFTIVNSFSLTSDPELTYEIELELLSEGIKSQYEYFKFYPNFEYLFKRFFENIFCLYELINSDYYHEKLSQKGSKLLGNIFGNYLEKNFDEKTQDKKN